MPNMPRKRQSESTTVAQFMQELNHEFGLELPTKFSKTHPLSKLWQAQLSVFKTSDTFLADSAVNVLWQSIQPLIDLDQTMTYTARGDPAAFPPFADDLNGCLVFVVTKQR